MYLRIESIQRGILGSLFQKRFKIARGVARIFNMGGPIFDDDDYYRRMDSLYI